MVELERVEREGDTWHVDANVDGESCTFVMQEDQLKAYVTPEHPAHAATVTRTDHWLRWRCANPRGGYYAGVPGEIYAKPPA